MLSWRRSRRQDVISVAPGPPWPRGAQHGRVFGAPVPPCINARALTAPALCVESIVSLIRAFFNNEYERHLQRTSSTALPSDVVFSDTTMPHKKLAVPEQDNGYDCGCFTIQYAKVRGAVTAVPCAPWRLVLPTDACNHHRNFCTSCLRCLRTQTFIRCSQHTLGCHWRTRLASSGLTGAVARRERARQPRCAVLPPPLPGLTLRLLLQVSARRWPAGAAWAHARHRAAACRAPQRRRATRRVASCSTGAGRAACYGALSQEPCRPTGCTDGSKSSATGPRLRLRVSKTCSELSCRSAS